VLPGVYGLTGNESSCEREKRANEGLPARRKRKYKHKPHYIHHKGGKVGFAPGDGGLFEGRSW